METKTPPDPVVLAVDVGGTKTRVGLFRRGRPAPYRLAEETVASASQPSLEAILATFLDGRRTPVDGACIGVAGPVIDGRSRTTNLPWTVSPETIAERFDWPAVRLINDLTATARAVATLPAADFHTIHPGRRDDHGPRALLAPGTGLGQALLVRAADRWQPLASEGGHADFAPRQEEELDLWRHLHRRFGHVSTERVVSGPGLVNIYEYLRDTGRYREPRWLARQRVRDDPARAVSEAALSRRTPIAKAALDRFASVLGAAAGNLALTGMCTGGVYIGGGIAPKILPAIDNDAFREAFKDKGRFRGLLNRIPVRVILNDRAALVGAALCALDATA